MNENAPIKMKQRITFRRLSPDTIRGEAIVIEQVISSFDKQKIDDLQRIFFETIGEGIITGYGKEQE